MDDLSHFMPRFRWGSVAPTSQGDRVRRGPGYQFYKIVPNDVMEFSGGGGIEELLEEGNAEGAKAKFHAAADLLAKEGLDALIIGGAPVSANFGRPVILDLIREVKEKHGIMATSPLEAFLAAMHHLGLKSVTVGSRWGDGMNQRIREYLDHGGIKLSAITTRGQSVDIAHAMTFEGGLDTALSVGREAGQTAPDADVILIPGGAAMSLHVVPMLEKEFGKPVMTNLTCEVWQVLVHSGVIPPVQGWGRLLATP